MLRIKETDMTTYKKVKEDWQTKKNGKGNEVMGKSHHRADQAFHLLLDFISSKVFSLLISNWNYLFNPLLPWSPLSLFFFVLHLYIFFSLRVPFYPFWLFTRPTDLFSLYILARKLYSFVSQVQAFLLCYIPVAVVLHVDTFAYCSTIVCIFLSVVFNLQSLDLPSRPLFYASLLYILWLLPILAFLGIY